RRRQLRNPLGRITGLFIFQRYYVQNDMLWPDGDFITMPEISQIFGELLGIWYLSEWMGAGKPSHFQLVEFGPGRGILVHLVEVSSKLSQVQAQALMRNQSQVWARKDEPVYRQGTITTGLPISWYRNLDDVPRGFSIYLAHEFFDALPIHKFQVHLLYQRLVEVCPEGGDIVQQLANRIAEDGGAGLIADYGHGGTKTDTFRGFKDHKLQDVLASPGSADLTAVVDFSYLRKMAGATVACMGPKTLPEKYGHRYTLTDPSMKAELIQGFDMLTNPQKMGERFQFFTMLNHSRLTRPEGVRNVSQKRTSPRVTAFEAIGIQLRSAPVFWKETINGPRGAWLP
uniref:Protein arginine methyltransferase NDUFAF7 n=1 Tax=Salmo trutta TaxID=8032 RepID=A0A674AQD0_SALTR